MAMQDRDLMPGKGDADAMADKIENVEGVDVAHLTRRVLWKMDTRLVFLFVWYPFGPQHQPIYGLLYEFGCWHLHVLAVP